MASIFKSLRLLADPTRLRIISLLAEEVLTVADLQEILRMGQSRISTQLSQLKNGGLAVVERSGKHHFYRARLTPGLKELVRAAVTELEEAEADRRALAYLLDKRRDASRRYFDELAGKFGRDYVPGRSWKALAEALLKVMSSGLVADLGCGEGTLTLLLAQRAQRVIGVDLSPKMVAYCQDLAAAQGLSHVEFRVGDLEQPPIAASEGVEFVIMSQALHHAQRPQRAIDSAFAILRPGGRLVILDLLEHQFEQARELYGDLWLGFSEAGLLAMMRQAGFGQLEVMVADREDGPQNFATLLAVGQKE